MNVYDGGRQSTAKLRPFFADIGVPYLMVNYIHWYPGSCKTGNDKIAKEVAETARNAVLAGYDVVAVGHSNGCAIIHHATRRYDANIKHCIYINPALGRALSPGVNVERTDIWYSPSDKPVKWSKIFRKSDARPWGEMGAKGYKGSDKRMYNFNKEVDFEVSSKTHSDVFDIDKLAFFGPMICNTALTGNMEN